jgi:pilus assembly protein Flp/PilA
MVSIRWTPWGSSMRQYTTPKNQGRRQEMKAMIKRFLKDEEGATMVEYGIMVALIAAICIVTIDSIGGKILAAFDLVDTNLP